jgi:hypothetical protein
MANSDLLPHAGKSFMIILGLVSLLIDEDVGAALAHDHLMIHSVG